MKDAHGSPLGQSDRPYVWEPLRSICDGLSEIREVCHTVRIDSLGGGSNCSEPRGRVRLFLPLDGEGHVNKWYLFLRDDIFFLIKGVYL